MSIKTHKPGSYGEIMAIALPLILSHGSISLRDFFNRVFLSYYSKEALAASLPSFIVLLSLGMFFIGVLYYTNVFVAQYSGAGKSRRIGESLWQGIWLAVFFGAITLAFLPFAERIFAAFGHEPEVQALEVKYFSIAIWGQIPWYVLVVLQTFYSGRGRTAPIMLVNLVAALVNFILDYLLILGAFGFPRMGISGAAIAFVTGNVTGCLMLVLMIFRQGNEERYGVRSGWRLNWDLLRRMVRYGMPQGVQFLLDVSAFSMFVLLVGRLGEDVLAATTVAINLNTFAFLPMLGLEVATSTLVGQYVGAKDIAMARLCVRRCFTMTAIYMGVAALAFVSIPSVFVNIYGGGETAASFESVRPIAVTLLRFVALYCVFDAAYIVFSAAIKGAGDTSFAMGVSIVYSITFISVMYLLCVQWKTHYYWPWAAFTGFAMMLGMVYWARYRHGSWERMRVIESE